MEISVSKTYVSGKNRYKCRLTGIFKPVWKFKIPKHMDLDKTDSVSD